MKRLTQANEMLSKSGLWPSIKQAIEHALSLSPEEIRELVDELDKNSYELYCEAQKKTANMLGVEISLNCLVISLSHAVSSVYECHVCT